VAATLPYLPSYKNVDKFFESLTAAKTPEAVTQRFLTETLGLKSTSDRALIPLLRQLGFIDGSGKPVTAYNALKNSAKVRSAMGDAIRRAYKPLFDANETADRLTGDELKGLIAQVAGTDKDMTSKIMGTFNALRRRADFTDSTGDIEDKKVVLPDEDEAGITTPLVERAARARGALGAGTPDFHFNIQIHLPANATEEVYVSIFAAIRRVFS
jgi:hypothetical protein